jgi:hypothetical protein
MNRRSFFSTLLAVPLAVKAVFTSLPPPVRVFEHFGAGMTVRLHGAWPVLPIGRVAVINHNASTLTWSAK